jgi:putative ABC transport system permease protein
MALAVLAQSFWVGIIGIVVALPLTLVLAQAATPLGVRVQLSPWLLIAAAAVTLATALLSGLSGLRPLRRLEPATLLR